MKRQKAGIIVTDLGGGDFMWVVCSEEDFKVLQEYNPTKKHISFGKEEEIFDTEKFIEFEGTYFYYTEGEDEGELNDKVLEHWFTQDFVFEDVNLSKYDIIGILTLPGC